MIKIGFISKSNPLNWNGWSGTIHKLYESIELTGICEPYWIPVKKSPLCRCTIELFSGYAKLRGKQIAAMDFIPIAKQLSNSIDPELINRADILFIPAECAYSYSLNTTKPIIYLTDVTVKILFNYYPELTNVLKSNMNQGNAIEQRALSKATKVICSSAWAQNSIINDYHIPKEKVSVIEFGANIDEADIAPHQTQQKDRIDILFNGVKWERKGGDIAVETCRILNQEGIKVTLHIVGIKKLDKDIQALPFVDYIGYLNKNDQSQYKRLINLMTLCDLLLLPTKAEASAIVFCEASAFELPVFTYDTGGISNYVINGVNGYRLDLNCTGKDFAAKIKTCINHNEFEKLRQGCRTTYKQKLNWNVWGQQFKQIVTSIICPPSQS